ncbi:ribosome-binding factor A [Streptococcus pyogenes]|nr:ribosome-binding factor A [Streptococcus pyogenes]VGR91688.1 ribosome-binding factor A [Streptococcus pyogenes]
MQRFSSVGNNDLFYQTSYLGYSFQSRRGILRFPLIVVIKTGSNVISWAFSLAFVLKIWKGNDYG